jgi:hypothetical protein
MPLTLHQKSVYLIIFNATMISRSVGKTLKGKNSTKRFKINVFEKLNHLCDLMNTGKLSEDDILGSIKALRDKFGISFGQAQKPINVIMKYHFYLTRPKDHKTKKVLHCPIDSVILKELNKSGLPLTKIDEAKYLELQKEIEKRFSIRINFDNKWDEQHLRDWGLL